MLYVDYQGTQVNQKRLLLMDVDNRHFTMHHLALGQGRVAKRQEPAICTPATEKRVLASPSQAYMEFEQRCVGNYARRIQKAPSQCTKPRTGAPST